MAARAHRAKQDPHVDRDATAAIVMPSPPVATIDIRQPRQYPVVPIADPLTSG